jgi:hypothetical protein
MKSQNPMVLGQPCPYCGEGSLIRDGGAAGYYCDRGWDCKQALLWRRKRKTEAKRIESSLCARIKELETENFALAAGLCHDGYGDESGRWRCKYQDRIKELEEALEPFAAIIVPDREGETMVLLDRAHVRRARDLLNKGKTE